MFPYNKDPFPLWLLWKSLTKRMKSLEHDDEVLYQVILENENEIDNLQQYVRREKIQIISGLRTNLC